MHLQSKTTHTVTTEQILNEILTFANTNPADSVAYRSDTIRFTNLSLLLKITNL